MSAPVIRQPAAERRGSGLSALVVVTGVIVVLCLGVIFFLHDISNAVHTSAQIACRSK